jgi:hypothetical protein
MRKEQDNYPGPGISDMGAGQCDQEWDNLERSGEGDPAME